MRMDARSSAKLLTATSFAMRARSGRVSSEVMARKMGAPAKGSMIGSSAATAMNTMPTK